MMSGDLDSDDRRLRLEVERVCRRGGSYAVTQLLIELGYARMVSSEIDRLVHHYVLTLDPPEGSA